MRRITRTGLRGVGLLAATGALCAVAVVPAVAAEPGASWQPELSGGSGPGVVVDDGGARFDRATAVGAPADESSDAEASADPVGVVPTGLLTLEPHTLDAPTREVGSTLVADTPPGSSATMDVRGRKPGGSWTEWIPAEGDRAELPETVREVQGRLVLSSTGTASPSVREVTLTAEPATGSEADAESGPQAEAAPRSYSVFATREGLEGGTTANGHKIAPRDRFVALPSRRALSANGKTDYSVKVCAPNGRCAIAPVWDIGPWNTKDDYWNPSNERQMWKDLPQGLPQAAAAFHDGHNGGKDQFDRKPANPAGIDLGDGIFWDVLGLKDNSQVQVDYLWTGSQRLSAVETEGAPDVQILARPEAGAESVGIAVDATEVPVQCTEGDFVRIGDEQYLPSSAFAQLPGDVPGCAAAPAGPGAAPGPADDDAAAAPTTPGTAPADEPETPGTAPATPSSPSSDTPDPATPSGTATGGTSTTPDAGGEPGDEPVDGPDDGPDDGPVPDGDRQAAAGTVPGSAQRGPSGAR
ncbi:hypothetical protein [Pseudonocardia sp. Ae150A_Ps1]|uniref:hypothetical protein n=1 Tax=Pseudonocardia sp. Ae150A_Ps1 TaxID=1885028 RepID=UPI00094AB259|nr:hypothetical protein [Pseudonocardia sp. Ae150A_Ps1]OLL74269.1 putative secreted protein [Pseudonocardia sp. Ae150A_Ps1]